MKNHEIDNLENYKEKLKKSIFIIKTQQEELEEIDNLMKDLLQNCEIITNDQSYSFSNFSNN